MIITCPHCQTKYQVTYEAIGSAGRKVQCAHCQQAWQQTPLERQDATPEQKQAFEAIVEDAMDEVMASEERAVAAAVKGKLATEKAVVEEAQRNAASKKQQKAFTRRHNAMVAELPLAKLRRTMRVAGVVLLAGLVAIAYFGRFQVVERFPAMAGIYDSVGLGVNVVGLDFSNVTTLRTLRGGKEVLVVSAQIVGLMAKPVPVPPVVITLMNAQGQPIYEWSVTPSVRDLMAGERATFDTQLVTPPGEAQRVRLNFAGGQSVQGGSAQNSDIAAAPPAAEPSDQSIAPEHH